MSNRKRKASPHIAAPGERFTSLGQRRSRTPERYAALRRREGRQAAVIQAARQKLATAGYRSQSSVKRVNLEGVPLGSQRPGPPISHAVVASVVIAFALPLFFAFIGGKMMPPVGLAHEGRHRGASVVGGAVGRPRELALRVWRQAPGSTHPATEVHQPTVLVRRHQHPPPQPERRGMPVGAQNPRMPSTKRTSASAAGHPMRTQIRPRASEPHSRHAITSGARVRLALALPPEAAPAREHAGPWTLSPDGTWRTEIEAPAGARDVSFSASGGELVKLEPSVTRPDAATLDIGWARPVSVVMTWPGHTIVRLLPAPDDLPEAFGVAARALGPHLVEVGWTPLGAASGVGSYEILRSGEDGDPPRVMAVVPAGQHTWQDRHVTPDAAYRYTVVAQAGDDPVQAQSGVVDTPPELDVQPVARLRGKGMFLYFSTLPGDAHNFRRYDPPAIVARARAAGIRVIELRMARGTCAMAETPESRAWLNQLIDAAAQSGITLLAWTVPRRSSAEDIARSVAAAAYRTPAGHGFAGLALDLETGNDYMGDGPAARRAMVAYVAAVRAALGPAYLLVAIVESPATAHGDYPYAAIARDASVLQPMAYWHSFDRSVHHKYDREEVGGAAARAVVLLRAVAGRHVTVDVAGQSVDLARTGSPSGREIAWSLAAARDAGAIGEVFFDWAGTRPDGWAAIQAFNW